MSRLKKTLRLVLSILFIGLIAWYIAVNFDKFQQINISNPGYLLLAAIFMLLSIYCQGKLIDIAVEPHGINLKQGEVIGLSAITRLGNIVSTGYAGTAIRASYFKSKHNVSYTKFSSSFVLSNVLQLLYSGIILILIYSFNKHSDVSTSVAVIIITSIIFMTLLLLTPIRPFRVVVSKLTSKFKNKFFKLLATAVEEYEKVRKHKGLLIRIFIWLIFSVLSSTGILTSIYHSLGTNISILSAMFISIMSSWAIIFAITPANIGISEGLLVFGAGIVGVSIPVTITLAIIQRFISVAVSAGISFFAAPKLFNLSLKNILSINRSDT